MDSSYQKLNIFSKTNSVKHLTNMPGRTPSFIVVGLVIIMFILGLFYMSCSSKNSEYRSSLEQFEERIRSLTIKSSEADKKYENLSARKRELDEEKLTIQRQMEKKDSEINDLNTRLNEKISELQSLNSDKKVLDEQLKDYRSLSESVAAKNSLIEKLQQQLNDQKQSNNDEVNRIKKEYETSKTNRSPQNNQLPSNNDQQNNQLPSNNARQNNQLPSNNEQQNTFIIPPQRFRPFIPNNYTTKSISSLFQDPLNKLNNLTKEVKPQVVQAAFDTNAKALDASGTNTNLSTSTTINQQQEIGNDKQQQQANQNVPAPPLANNAQLQQQPDHVESAQAAPKSINDNQPVAGDHVQDQKNIQRSFDNPIPDNKNEKLSDINENDDEKQLGLDNVDENINPMKDDNLENNNQPIDRPVLPRSNRKNSRLSNRRQYRQPKERFRQNHQLDHGEEMDDDNNGENRNLRKRRLF